MNTNEYHAFLKEHVSPLYITDIGKYPRHLMMVERLEDKVRLCNRWGRGEMLEMPVAEFERLYHTPDLATSQLHFWQEQLGQYTNRGSELVFYTGWKAGSVGPYFEKAEANRLMHDFNEGDSNDNARLVYDPATDIYNLVSSEDKAIPVNPFDTDDILTEDERTIHAYGIFAGGGWNWD